jgi:hypothetical protein
MQGSDLQHDQDLPRRHGLDGRIVLRLMRCSRNGGSERDGRQDTA